MVGVIVIDSNMIVRYYTAEPEGELSDLDGNRQFFLDEKEHSVGVEKKELRHY